MLEAFGSEQEGDERHVAGVHGLEGEAGGGAVEVGVVDEILDRFQHLLQERALNQTKFQHLVRRIVDLGFWSFLKEEIDGEMSSRESILNASVLAFRVFGSRFWFSGWWLAMNNHL